MSGADLSPYEQECLAEVKRTLLGHPTLERDGVIIQDISVIGQLSERKIVVSLSRQGESDTLEWRLGKNVFSGVPQAGDLPEPPKGVATALLVEALGG